MKRELPGVHLVTGGCGHIGSYIVDHIVENNGNDTEIVVVDNMYNGHRSNLDYAMRVATNKGIRIHIHPVDISNFSDLEYLFMKYQPRYVFHQASMLTLDSKAYRNKAIQTNIVGSANVFELCLRPYVEKLVYASSASVFGDPQYIPVDENHPLECKLLYGATKIADEYLAKSFCDEEGLKFIGLRYFNVYGPRQSMSNVYTQIVPKWINALLDKKPITVYGNGEQTMDMIFGRDVGALNYTAMFRMFHRHCNLMPSFDGFVNIGSGEQTSVKELLALLHVLFDELGIYTESEVTYDPHDPNMVKRRQCNNNLMKKLLSTDKPLTSVKKGLQECIYSAMRRREI